MRRARRLAAFAAANGLLGAVALAGTRTAAAQSRTAPVAGAPIAIIPLAAKKAGAAPTVTGALEVTGDEAIIAASGAITSGDATTKVILPRRGTLDVCASTTVKLAADTSVPSDEVPGLLMALSHGALEAKLATGPNSDMVLTPNFRILISGPGKADVKVRLGRAGDTCVDNAGIDAPYVLVTSLFGDGLYRVDPEQRVMFEHGSVHEVVDADKEPCGCPPPPPPAKSNAFPLAQSEGLAPLAKPAPLPAQIGPKAELRMPLVYSSAAHAPKPAPAARPSAAVPAKPAAKPAPAAHPHSTAHKRGLFRAIGRFFRRLFGAG